MKAQNDIPHRNETPRNRIAAQIAKARKSRSWTLHDLGRRVGRDPARLSEIETGRANPSLDNLLDMADALNLELVLVPRRALAGVMAGIGDADLLPPPPPMGLSVLDEVLIPDGYDEEPQPVRRR